MELRLRPVRLSDEDGLLAAHRTMQAESFPFLLAYEDGIEWERYVDRLQRNRAGIDLPDGSVPATFLVAECQDELVGRVSVRHRLNDFLVREGGHIGYGVLPPFRRRGIATEMLRQAILVARAEGVSRVLVCCDDDNIGSAAVIERCGGQLESVIPDSRGTQVRRYWIT